MVSIDSSKSEDPFDLINGSRDYLAKKLIDCGAILLRGFPEQSPSKFGDFARSFSGSDLLDYRGGASPRIQIAPGVYTSTEYPQTYQLSLHNEMSYTFPFPRRLFFYCIKPAQSGGATPIADSRLLLKTLNQTLVEDFRRRKIMYVRHLDARRGSGYSWQDAFETDDRREVEDYCMKGEIDWEWCEDTSLLVKEIQPATRFHPETNEEVWFNQADSFHSVVDGKQRLRACYADGENFSNETLTHIRSVMSQQMVPIAWQPNDILILDNMLAAHGREPFSGPRKILVALT